MKKELSLLQQAIELASNRSTKLEITDEDIELCVAWAIGRISLTQVQQTKGLKGTLASVYNYLLRCLRQYVIKMCKDNKAECLTERTRRVPALNGNGKKKKSA